MILHPIVHVRWSAVMIQLDLSRLSMCISYTGHTCFVFFLGYLYEVCKTTMGPGGFMCVVQHVMQRNKVTDDAFGDKKFQQQNLNRIDEAVMDVAMAYGLAAVQEFKASAHFHSDAALAAHQTVHGNHHELLLSSFKEWIEVQSSRLPFRYHSQLITLFGPMRELYLSSVKFADGVGREAVWMVMLPLFAQLQKRNYWTEAFVHVSNIVAAWPLATRLILQNNCSVSVKGREGHNIALDEWVETYLVQSLKNYASGLLLLFIIVGQTQRELNKLHDFHRVSFF